MKTFDDIWHERSASLKCKIFALRRNILEMRENLIKQGTEEMRFCKSASGMQDSGYYDIKTGTPISVTKCKKKEGSLDDSADSYDCARCVAAAEADSYVRVDLSLGWPGR